MNLLTAEGEPAVQPAPQRPTSRARNLDDCLIAEGLYNAKRGKVRPIGQARLSVEEPTSRDQGTPGGTSGMVEWLGVLATLVCGFAGATPAWLALRKVPKHEVPAELFRRSSDLLRELHYSPGEKPDLKDIRKKMGRALLAAPPIATLIALNLRMRLKLYALAVAAVAGWVSFDLDLTGPLLRWLPQELVRFLSSGFRSIDGADLPVLIALLAPSRQLAIFFGATSSPTTGGLIPSQDATFFASLTALEATYYRSSAGLVEEFNDRALELIERAQSADN